MGVWSGCRVDRKKRSGLNIMVDWWKQRKSEKGSVEVLKDMSQRASKKQKKTFGENKIDWNEAKTYH